MNKSLIMRIIYTAFCTFGALAICKILEVSLCYAIIPVIFFWYLFGERFKELKMKGCDNN